MNDICPICGGVKLESATIFTADFKTGVVLIKEVPAFICNQCGEEWFEDKVAEKVESIIKTVKKQNPEICILRYN